MQNTSTRVVTFEMCGNDYLQARSDFAGQSGTCNYGGINTALANCTTYTERAMQAINTYATTAKRKVIANLYYPGYDADNALSGCTDGTTGQKVNKQTMFLQYLAASNWMQCDKARTYGFACADSFAEYMAADYDSNGDGLVDSDALRYQSGESQSSYVDRIMSLRATLRDANVHLVNSSTSFDYIQSDNTHPTYTGGTIGLNIFTLTGSGSGAPEYGAGVGGKNSVWNRYGHERMGWSISTYLNISP